MALWTNLNKSKKEVKEAKVNFFEDIRNVNGHALDMKYYLQTRNLSIDIFDKNLCGSRAEDIFDPTSVFENLKLYESDSYIDVNKHCYSLQTLIRSLFSYFDLKLIKDDLRESGCTLQLSDIYIVKLLAQYMETIERDKTLSQSAYAKKYASIYVNPSVFKEFKKDREDFLNEINEYHMPQLKQYGNWHDKFKYLAIDYREEETYKAIKNIYKYSANTLLELVGLFGYLCAVDDSFVDAYTDSSTTNFQIASSCINKIIDFKEKLQAIPKLNEIFKTIKFGGNTINSILESTVNTCIHGVGYNCIRFYLSFYYYSQLHKERILKETQTVKEIMNDLESLNAENIKNILIINNLRFSTLIEMLDEPFDTTQLLIKQAMSVDNKAKLDSLIQELRADAERVKAAAAEDAAAKAAAAEAAQAAAAKAAAEADAAKADAEAAAANAAAEANAAKADAEDAAKAAAKADAAKADAEAAAEAAVKAAAKKTAADLASKADKTNAAALNAAIEAYKDAAEAVAAKADAAEDAAKAAAKAAAAKAAQAAAEADAAEDAAEAAAKAAAKADAAKADAAKAAKAAAFKFIKSKLKFDVLIYSSNNILKHIAEARYYGIEYIENTDLEKTDLIKNIKEATKQVIQSIKDAQLYSIPLDSPELVDIYENITQLAPFLIVAPKTMQEATHIKYLTCSRIDVPASELKENPFNIKYLITGFKDLPLKSNDGTHIGILKLDDNLNNNNNIESLNDKNLKFYPMAHINKARAEIYKETFEGSKSYNIVKKLLSIPATFQKHRIKMFDSYVNYCLNLCKIMSSNNNNLIEFLKKQKYYNIISCEEENFIPKYFCGITNNKLFMSQPEDINLTLSHFDYTDNILDFTNLSYNASGKITNPYNPATDLTEHYHEAKLIVKILKRPKFEDYMIYNPKQVSADILDIAKDFNSFCGYYYLLQGQACDFQNLLNTSIKINTGEKYLNAVNILTVDFENIDQYNNESYDYYLDLLKDTMQEIIIYSSLFLDIEEYKYNSLATAQKKPANTNNSYTLPIYSDDNDYMMAIKSMYKVFDKLKLLKKKYLYHGFYVLNPDFPGNTHAYIKNILIPVWSLLIKRIINFVTCNMSSSIYNVNYHYKELLDEYYFLEKLDKAYTAGTDAGTYARTYDLKKADNISKFISVWNNDNNIKLVDSTDDTGISRESIAFAHEYISKLWLLQKQKCKVQVLKGFIDKALKLPITSIPESLNAFFKTGDFSNIATLGFNHFIAGYLAMEESLMT